MSRNVNWRPAADWPAVAAKFPADLQTAVVLVEDKRRGLFLEEVYRLGDKLVLNRPLATFEIPLADGADWRRFAVVVVHRVPKPSSELVWTRDRVEGTYSATDHHGRPWLIARYADGSRFRISTSPPELGLSEQIDTLRELKTSIDLRLAAEPKKVKPASPAEADDVCAE